jgi:hypothetical protein
MGPRIRVRAVSEEERSVVFREAAAAASEANHGGRG